MITGRVGDAADGAPNIAARVRHQFATAKAIVGRMLGSPVLSIVILVVLLADSVIEGLDVWYRYRRLTGAERISEYFYLSNDRGIGEYFEYLLTAMAGCAILAVAKKHSARKESRLLIVAGLLFVWLTLDNSLMIHENFGVLLQRLVGPHDLLGIDVQDMGELCIYALSVLAVLIGLRGTIRPPLSTAELIALGAICVAAAGAIFGVGVDMVHSMIPLDYPILREVAGFIEDSGELWLLSLASLLAMGIILPDAFPDAP
ncbi:MAG: hypothetical protein AB7G25_08865 [Sphingomonadaceae bacterium]